MIERLAVTIIAMTLIAMGLVSAIAVLSFGPMPPLMAVLLMFPLAPIVYVIVGTLVDMVFDAVWPEAH